MRTNCIIRTGAEVSSRCSTDDHQRSVLATKGPRIRKLIGTE